MKNFLIIALSLLSFSFMISNAKAVTCFKSDEYVSGLNKICIYSCMGSDAAITIGSTQLCPLTIQR